MKSENFLHTLLLVAVFLLPIRAVQAKMDEAPPSPRLLWQGKDVPPPCIDQLYPMGEPAPPSVDLPACVKDENDKPWKFEMEGYGLTTNYKEGEGFFAYQVIGQVADGIAVQTSFSGGGTGFFSGVAVVKVEGDKLISVRTFDGGDRCNGGVHASRIENGKVVVENHITPGDFASIAYGSDRGIKAYDDVMAGAGSCVGQSLSVDGTITHIILDREAFEIDISDHDAENYPLQRCFNKHVNTQVKKATMLDMPTFTKMMDEILSACSRTGGSE